MGHQSSLVLKDCISCYTSIGCYLQYSSSREGILLNSPNVGTSLSKSDIKFIVNQISRPSWCVLCHTSRWHILLLPCSMAVDTWSMNSRQRIPCVCWYCEVHRGPERVQVLEVNVPLIDVEIWTSAYLVFILKAIAQWHAYKIASGQNVWGHGWVMFPSMIMLALVTMLRTDLSATPWACLSLVGEVSIRYPSLWQNSRNSADWYPASISTLILRSMTEPFGFQSGCAKKSSDMLVVSSETNLDLVNTGYTCLKARSVNRWAQTKPLWPTLWCVKAVIER